MDGIPINRISVESLRDRISIVSQNSFLFSDSIRNNVRYSAPDATEEDFINAVKITGVKKFAERLPLGLDTEIGERGFCLSGGEKQKISITRAILRKSDILFFDEATTHLDESSILLIGFLIKKMSAEKTCLIISHRAIESLKIDRYYWIERGRCNEISKNSSVIFHSNPARATRESGRCL